MIYCYRLQGRWCFHRRVAFCTRSASWLLIHCLSLLRCGRSASYWNAFLLQRFMPSTKPEMQPELWNYTEWKNALTYTFSVYFWWPLSVCFCVEDTRVLFLPFQCVAVTAFCEGESWSFGVTGGNNVGFGNGWSWTNRNCWWKKKTLYNPSWHDWKRP